MESGLLDRVLAPGPPPMALLHRPETTGPGVVDVLVGEVSNPRTLAEIDLAEDAGGGPRHEVLTLIPYRQIAERGFACVDDGEPLIAMRITEQETVGTRDLVARLPRDPIHLSGQHFDVADDDYADIVHRVVTEEIGAGEGANFVIKRSFCADIGSRGTRSALSLFRRLLDGESGAYWTFIVHTGFRTFVGATPERQISLHSGVATMNPVSGTYRYPDSGPSLPGIMEFLANTKETDELHMVVDEELKMMTRVCDDDVRVTGPFLKEMARLAHTEYFIDGRTSRDPREILRETMFAPTVTGSPLENACRAIARHEPHGRGYYSGVAALIGRDAGGNRAIDSAILIRTADIDDRGRARIGVGATLVRHSDPYAEVAETEAKAAGLRAAMHARDQRALSEHPRVHAALAQRNAALAAFWLAGDAERETVPVQALAGRRVLVVDAEDAFTSMIEYQLGSLGPAVTIRRFDEPYTMDDYDLVVLGPGPGDPCDARDPKIEHLRTAVRALLARRQPFLAVCLSHQVLCAELRLPLVRREQPNQGLQREIDLFGARERVGFYNTFVAHSQEDKVGCGDAGVVEVSRDANTGEVHALRGPHFASMQFHPESVLTQDGPRIVSVLVAGVLAV